MKPYFGKLEKWPDSQDLRAEARKSSMGSAYWEDGRFVLLSEHGPNRKSSDKRAIRRRLKRVDNARRARLEESDWRDQRHRSGCRQAHTKKEFLCAFPSWTG